MAVGCYLRLLYLYKDFNVFNDFYVFICKINRVGTNS